MNKKVEKFLIYIIEIICILILSFLTVESIFKTCSINGKETTSYLLDNPLIHIITICMTILIFMFIKAKKIRINKKWLWCFIGIAIIIAIMWICISDIHPTSYKRSDQKYIYDIVKQMRKGIWEEFEPGRYAASNPHQYGFILYEYLLNFIFGSKDYIVMQFINLGALLVSFFCIYKITRKMFRNRETSVATIITLILFIPIWFYITFIYGNLLGLACSMFSVLAILNYLETKKVKYLLLSSVSIALAIVFKSNYLVTLLAIICVLILEMISNKNLKAIPAILVLIIGYIAINSIAPITIQKITGREEIEKTGIPMITYVEMGLQKGKRAPGWFNGYNRIIYKKNQYDSKKTEEAAKKDLKKTIQELKNNPKIAAEFFYKKTVSQWNNPTFQSFWIGREFKTKPAIVRAVNGNGKVNKVITAYMNITQTIILVGATAFMIINFKKNNSKQLIFAIIFIGGFLFHMIWEAKCQYTITYFILLIPYTVRGYVQIAEWLSRKIEQNKCAKENN